MDASIKPLSTRSEFNKAVEAAVAAARAYYDTDVQLMSDAEYDQLIEAIQLATATHPDWKASGLLDAVAAGASAGGDVPHPSPMLSLSKAKERKDVAAFVSSAKGKVVVEPKLDGLAIRAEYVKGKLIRLVTRGDGLAGEDLTAQAQDVTGLPAKLRQALTLDVRGEIYMTDSDFEVANRNRVASGKPAFVNPRNATSGVLRNQDLDYHPPLSFAAYDAFGGALGRVDDYVMRMSALDKAGIATALSLVRLPAGRKPWSAPNPETVLSLVDAVEGERSTLGSPIDGAVVKVASYGRRDQLGAATSAPRWAVAFKYPADVATTKLLGIEVNVGRTGNMSLRAVLEPVFVGGTTITYATLHNPKFVTDAGMGIGAVVYVYRAGDVIPRVSAVASRGKARRWKGPKACPNCGQPWDDSAVVWKCRTPACSTVGRIGYAASRDALDIDGLSTALAEALVETGKVADVADLFRLSAVDIATLPLGDGQRLVGTTVAAKIHHQIQGARQKSLARFITALGLRGTGRTISRRLATHFGTLDSLAPAKPAQLAQVDGIGTERAAVIAAELKTALPVIRKLRKLGIDPREQGAASVPGQRRPLDGLTVVVTGNVPGMTRTQAQEAVEALGGRSSGSVSKSTSLVVVGDGAGSKAQRAEQLGIRTMGAMEFATLAQRGRT